MARACVVHAHGYNPRNTLPTEAGSGSKVDKGGQFVERQKFVKSLIIGLTRVGRSELTDREPRDPPMEWLQT